MWQLSTTRFNNLIQDPTTEQSSNYPANVPTRTSSNDPKTVRRESNFETGFCAAACNIVSQCGFEPVPYRSILHKINNRQSRPVLTSMESPVCSVLNLDKDGVLLSFDQNRVDGLLSLRLSSPTRHLRTSFTLACQNHPHFKIQLWLQISLIS